MKNIKYYFFSVALFLAALSIKSNGTTAQINSAQIAQVLTNVQNSYSSAFLMETSIEIGKSCSSKSVDVLTEILKRCDELDYINSTQQAGNQTDIVRAYAIFYLARQSDKILRAKTIIEDNFVMKRPICIALSKAKYYNLYKLMDNEISRLFSKYPSTINDKNAVADIIARHSGIRFILKNKIGAENKVVNKELLDAMLDCALSVESIRLSKYFTLCKKMLEHEGSYLWNKPVIRAVMKNKTSNFNKFNLIRKELKSARNKETDNCEWNLNQPETVTFSIKNISYEAYLAISLWRLNVELKKKISEILPSLASSSFTARAAAVDCLASNEKTIPILEKVLESNDEDLRKFLALRIENETNAPAKKLLRKLKKD